MSHCWIAATSPQGGLELPAGGCHVCVWQMSEGWHFSAHTNALVGWSNAPRKTEAEAKRAGIKALQRHLDREHRTRSAILSAALDEVLR